MNNNLKGSVQKCVKSEIDVLRKGASGVFKLVIYTCIRIGTWPNDGIIMIVFVSQHLSSIKHGSITT